jgi:hypothetical protein
MRLSHLFSFNAVLFFFSCQSFDWRSRQATNQKTTSGKACALQLAYNPNYALENLFQLQTISKSIAVLFLVQSP